MMARYGVENQAIMFGEFISPGKMELHEFVTENASTGRRNRFKKWTPEWVKYKIF